MEATLVAKIQQLVQHKLGGHESNIAFSRVEGGSINEAYHVAYGDQEFFLKVNRSIVLPAFFQSECDGLNKLHRASKIKTPLIHTHDIIEHTAFLLMEWIQTVLPTSLFWERLAVGLAEVHQQKAEYFGLEYDNYVGSLPQPNRFHSKWADFWVEERIMPQLMGCKSVLPRPLIKALENCCKRANELFPIEPPALLHGDLWIGNVLCGKKQQAYLIDPAIYYGHREMDIAMTLLFGGFSSEFYKVYQMVNPMAKGWEERMGLSMLYPLLIHVNLFGSSYVEQIEQIMKKWKF